MRLKISFLVQNLECLHGVKGHDNGGHKHERHGDVGDNVGGAGGLRVFNQIPDTFLVPGGQSSSVSSASGLLPPNTVVTEYIRDVLLHVLALSLHFLDELLQDLSVSFNHNITANTYRRSDSYFSLQQDSIKDSGRPQNSKSPLKVRTHISSLTWSFPRVEFSLINFTKVPIFSCSVEI